MTYQDEAQTVNSYMEWRAKKQTTSNDLSGERYVIEKAQQEAFERVEKAIAYLKRDGTKTGMGAEYPGIYKALLMILEGE